MRCIFGLGNPGRDYDGTRHNCGFLVLDELDRRHGPFTWRKDWGGLVADWPTAPGGRTLLVKPQTYMNLSGQTVQAAMAYHKLSALDVLVVVDDIHIALGHLRLRSDGSPGGHNGLKDIQARIGAIYPRLRMGVDKPPAGGDQVNWVLGRFLPEEAAAATAMVKRAADCCEAWLVEGMPVASRFNGPGTPPPARKSPTGDAQPPVPGAPKPEA
jgi:PTH1 family peptidyl-tRNA hydrolase